MHLTTKIISVHFKTNLELVYIYKSIYNRFAFINQIYILNSFRTNFLFILEIKNKL